MQTVAYWLLVPFVILALVFEALSDQLMAGVEWIMQRFVKGN